MKDLFDEAVQIEVEEVGVVVMIVFCIYTYG